MLEIVRSVRNLDPPRDNATLYLKLSTSRLPKCYKRTYVPLRVYQHHNPLLPGLVRAVTLPAEAVGTS